MDVIAHPCWDKSETIEVKGAPDEVDAWPVSFTQMYQRYKDRLTENP